MPVFGFSGDLAHLARIIDQFGCDMHAADRPCPPGSAVAVIVEDIGDDALRLCDYWSASCPVLLVSDQTSFDFRAAAAKAGVTALVRRPINAVEVSEWLADFVARTTEASASVLIVDDDGIAASITAEILRSTGIAVSVINDPGLVLDHLDRAHPDLILMDVEMPGIDGIRLTQIIRQTRRLVSLPILFLSGERDESRQFAARRLGGDDFVERPIPPQRLIDIVRMRIARSKVLRAMIERDRLTGLYNHTSFEERLGFELDRCLRTGSEVCLAIIDVDHFKAVNDTYGHATGDTVLRTLSGALLAGARRIDVIGRLGGEEFGIILLDAPEKDAALAVDRLRRDFQSLPFDTPSGAFNVTFSAGIACSRSFGSDLHGMISAADGALYAAKRGGRNMLRTASTADAGVMAA